jgi:hypothetical protein
MPCDLLPPLVRTCFLLFEQFIGQQMVWLQDSISKHLHLHTFPSMFFDMIFKAHRAQILSCSSARVGVWLTIWLIFLSFWPTSLVFSTVFQIRLGLPHLLVASILQCGCTHPIDPMGIHLLCCAHDDEHTWTHDAIHDTSVAIAHDASSWGQEQLHVLLSNTFNSSHRRVDIVLMKETPSKHISHLHN